MHIEDEIIERIRQDNVEKMLYKIKCELENLVELRDIDGLFTTSFNPKIKIYYSK